MPEQRLARMRQTLPNGYQFGAARYGIADLTAHRDRLTGSLNRLAAGAQKALDERDGVGVWRVRVRDWNVIEGEQH